MTPSRTVPRLPRSRLAAVAGVVGLAAATSLGSPSIVKAAPAPKVPAPAAPLAAPSPLNPAWAFDPNGPSLQGSPPPGLLLPNGGQPFNPARPNQPEAIHGPRPPIPPCPLIVSVKDAPLQPLHLHPAQVPMKNSFGCLSPSDAIYGPDGCPRRLCGTTKGYQIPLPPGGP